MAETRIKVWVQRFKDRPALMLQWTDPSTGKRRSRTAGTADEEKAEQGRQALEYELNNGIYQDVSKMTWDRFRELFEEEYVGGRRDNTRRNYAVMFDLFERICSPRSLRSVTERTVSQFVAGLRREPGRRKGSKGMMASTIKVRLQFLHTALSWAAEQKMIPEVPKFPALTVPKKDPQPVPLDSFERLYAQAGDDHMRAYLLSGWLAGLRLSEALAIEWEPNDAAPYLDLTRNRIVLPAEFAKAVRDQWVPIDPDLRRVLERQPRKGPQVFRFTNARGEVLGPGAISQRVRKLAVAAGVRLTMHTLRKGFGCRYAGKVPAQVLQRLMRHASLKTTMDYYANIDDAVEQAVLGQFCNSNVTNAPPITPRPDAKSA